MEQKNVCSHPESNWLMPRHSYKQGLVRIVIGKPNSLHNEAKRIGSGFYSSSKSDKEKLSLYSYQA